MVEASRTDRTGGEIDWPDFMERTPERERERTSKFKVGMGQAIDEIRDELENRIGVDGWRLSTAAPHRKKDGRPYANANPDDPGAVVRWTKDEEQFAVAADEYDDLRDNIRATGLYLTEKRKMSNRPVTTGQDEFATARLPSGDEDAIVTDVPAHVILEVPPDAGRDEIEAAYREKVKEVHPDRNGDGDSGEFKRVKRAKEDLLDV